MRSGRDVYQQEERMAGRNLARLGGVCGLLFVLLMVPAYVVGYPVEAAAVG